ncbi:hypothetical protein BACOVA_04903 [Bacteroides ovatus ATCC 8483]|uniref:Uncharacterized protein n=1 Tax=Bacteroides ovatus (strain ATCC 8483 / DSM 1896 / JCM 5824 / BCRC 10623 / CCUG 4943 / NCTC 11153) TaxID=411476 RepID=A0AAN3A4J1_BACO1|nr:hypothetical protein BACOVA_04903 [Bacteroides ovatus ATCC 8483]
MFSYSSSPPTSFIFCFYLPPATFCLYLTCNQPIAALQILLQIPLQMFICNTLYNPILHADKFSFHV